MLPLVVTLVFLVLNSAPALASPFGLLHFLKRGTPTPPGHPSFHPGPPVSEVCKDVKDILSIFSRLDAPATSFCRSLLNIGTSTAISTFTPATRTTKTTTTTTSTNVHLTTTTTTSTETDVTTTITTTTATEIDTSIIPVTATIDGGFGKRAVNFRVPIATPPALSKIAGTILSKACSCLKLQASVATTITTLPSPVSNRILFPLDNPEPLI
jgi:hypothetical protein